MKETSCKIEDMVRITTKLCGLSKDYVENNKGKFQWATRKFLTYLNSQLNSQHIYNTEYFVKTNKTFQKAFNSMLTQIMGIITRCDAKTQPAEKILTDIEIMIALNQNPALINRCANPSVELQMYICEKNQENIKHIKHPAPEVVNFVVVRMGHYGATKYIDACLLPANVKITAFTKGELPDNKFTKAEVLNYLENDPDATTVCTAQFVQTIESKNELFTPAELKQFRLALIRIQAKASHNGLEIVSNRPILGNRVCTNLGIYNLIKSKESQEFFIKYMNNPDPDVCMESVYLMPYSIGEVHPQTDELQETALRQGFENSFDLKRIYSYLYNPSDEIQMLYSIMYQIRRSAIIDPQRADFRSYLMNRAIEYGISVQQVEKALQVLGNNNVVKRSHQRSYGA